MAIVQRADIRKGTHLDVKRLVFIYGAWIEVDDVVYWGKDEAGLKLLGKDDAYYFDRAVANLEEVLKEHGHTVE